MKFERKIRNTKKWHDLTKQIRYRDEQLCQICLHLFNVKLLATPKSVHHIRKIKHYPELAYDKFNLVTLCASHHKKVDLGITFTDKKGKVINIEKFLIDVVKAKYE